MLESWGVDEEELLFRHVHKRKIIFFKKWHFPQLSGLRIYPRDSHNAANVISRVNVPPRLQRTHLSGSDTLPSPPPPSLTPGSIPFLLITQLSNTAVRPHWSAAEVRLYIRVCLEKIRKQTAETFHYYFDFIFCLSQTAREVNSFFSAAGDSCLKI